MAFVNERPINYNPALVYNNSTGTWIAQSTQLPKAGEKLTFIIAIVHNEIYFGII